MRYFPIFMDLQDQRVLVVGGGKVAARKSRLLVAAGAQVEIAARRLGGEAAALCRDGKARQVSDSFSPALLEAVRLVYAASDDPELNREVFEQAEARGIPVNAVDDPRHCRFITPAMVDRDPIQVAISSSGTSPVLARLLRSWLERALPRGIGRVARVAGRLRADLNARWNVTERRRRWDALFGWQNLLRLSELDEATLERRMRRAFDSPATSPGKVYLVGAGPGNPDLLTLRALQLLGQADVILHDKLVPEAILELARRDAERIDVGKRAGGQRMEQSLINRLMVREARRGRLVVRLKGGDPLVFGRGGEEREYLSGHGIECEIVPGVSAANACAAEAGIALTHREHASVLSFVTGHHAQRDAPIDWRALAGPDRTLAIYMGTRQASAIRERLIGNGVDAGLPVALVINGSLPGRRLLRGSVDSLPRLATAMREGDVGMLIVGDVAAQANADQVEEQAAQRVA